MYGWMDVRTMSACPYGWMDGWMDVCIHVCIHIHTNTHTVTHICMHMNAYAHACTQERTSCPGTKQRPRGTDRQTAAVPRRNLPPKSHRRYVSSMHSRRVSGELSNMHSRRTRAPAVTLWRQICPWNTPRVHEYA